MTKKDLFITFSVPHLFQSDEKFAVRCKDMDDAREVGQDACSLVGIKNVRLRKCGKPGNRTILSYGDYFDYDWYY